MSSPSDLGLVRGPFVRRVVAVNLWGALQGGCVLVLFLGLPGQNLVKALAFALLPLALASCGVVWMLSAWRLSWALASAPEDAPGDRLRRILELPRRIEIWTVLPTLIGTEAALAGVCSAAFDAPANAVGYGAAIGVIASLIPGLVLTMLLERRLLPAALDELQRRPEQAVSSRRWYFWPRQRWYLPYAFAALLLSLLGFAGLMVVSLWRRTSNNLAEALEAQGMGHVTGTVVDELEALLRDGVVQIGALSLVLLAAYLLTGSMLASRQTLAVNAVEGALRALARGSSLPPRWVATDETGDLARAAWTVSSEMERVFSQLQTMASGNLTQELSGESGLVAAFRASQAAMLELARRMASLSKGELATGASIPGDLGVHFRQLVSALQAIAEQAQTIAGGDLRRDVEVPGALGQAIRQMTGNLRTMVAQTQSVSGNIGDIVVSLQSASSQLSTATTEQVAAVTETANTMTEMAQTSAISADRASDLIKQGESAAQVVEEGNETAHAAVSAVEVVAAAFAKVSSATASLTERIRRIDGIAEAVGFLADQSSTLAVNAAIEAARAGEAGKGFAVVAKEMRELASDSRRAVSEIRQLSTEILERTGEVEQSVTSGTRTADESSDLVRKLGEAVAILGMTLHDAVDLMRQVEGSARQHQAGVGQVSQALTNMQRASESIRDGARMLGDLSSKAHALSTSLQKTTGTYALPSAHA